MNDLYIWLLGQNISLGTYHDFQIEALKVAAHQFHEAAAARMLADIAGRFAYSYDGQPLTEDVAAVAFSTFLQLTRRACEVQGRPAQEQLEFLNGLGQADLLCAKPGEVMVQ